MGFYRNLSIEQKRVVWAWGFLLVPIIFYVSIRFYPTASAFVLSFQNWNLLGDRTWAGLENYSKLFADPVFWKVFGNTFMYLILGTPISLLISFVVAYQLDKVRFMHGAIRALYFLPFMTSAVAMAWVWRWFYQPVPIGVFNNTLAAFGFSQVAFLNSTTNACPRSWRLRCGPGSASRSSSSWRACARSRRPTTRRHGSTACRAGR